MRRLTNLILLIMLAVGCGDAPEPTSECNTTCTAGGETLPRVSYGVTFTDVREQQPSCFYFSGPGELGRDDQLLSPATFDGVSLQFGGGQLFAADGYGALIRISEHEYNGTWTVRERIMLTSTDGVLYGDYRYEEIEPGATTPGECRIDARIQLGTGVIPEAHVEGACHRAADCCVAYVTAMGMDDLGESSDGLCDRVRAFESAGPEAEPACGVAVSSFRQSLSAIGLTIPAVCEGE